MTSVDSQREVRDLLAELQREQRQFEAYLQGVRVGTRLPLGDLGREEFRERVYAGFRTHQADE